MTRTFLKRNMYAVAALMAATAACGQWSFTLDTTFRTQIVQQNVNAIHVLPGTGIYLSGRVRFPGDMSDRPLSLIDETGVQVVSFPFSWGGGKMVPWENKLYVQNGNLVRRMNLDGTIDLSFASQSGGSGSAPYISLPTNGDFHVFPDGSVLLSGSYTLSDTMNGFVGWYRLVWLTNTGYLDTTRAHRTANGPIWGFKELPDGKFICSCSCTQYEGQPVSRLFRVHADGALDTTFQSDVVNGNIYTYEMLANGSILVGGNYRRSVVPQDTIRLAKFLPDGTFDITFAPLTFDGNPLWWPWFGTQVFDIFPFTADRYIIAGQFTTVNGQPRSGLCMIDSSGQLMPELEDFYVGPFTYQTTTNAGFTNVYWNQDSTALYVCGTYAGCSDGTTNDPQQRFVSRLLVSELTTGVVGKAPRVVSIRPNPASGTCTVELEELPLNAVLIVRDALGRERLRQPVRSHSTTLYLHTLSDGIYILELLTPHKRVATQRLVVQH